MYRGSCTLVEAENLFGLVAYESRWGQKVRNKSLDGDYRFVYDFKKYNRHSEAIGQFIEQVAAVFGCDTIVAVPSSGIEPNNLQLLFGEAIRRVYQVDKVKYQQGTYTFDDASVEVEEMTGCHILLVDDVVTTGQTMAYFRSRLVAAGAVRVSCLAVGLNTKLDPQPAVWNDRPVTVQVETPAAKEAEPKEPEVSWILNLLPVAVIGQLTEMRMTCQRLAGYSEGGTEDGDESEL